MKNCIKIYSNQFPEDLCDQLINIFDDNDLKGSTEDGDFGVQRIDPSFKNSKDLSLRFDGEDSKNRDVWDYIMSCIYCPIQDYINTFIPTASGEKSDLSLEYTKKTFGLLQPPKIKKYDPPDGGYHAWHQDWGLMPVQARRFLVVMAYLNDVEAGGETAFFHQDLKIKPKKGTVVVFPPYFTHIHKGYPPVSSSKYICNCYIGVSGEVV